MPKRKSPPAPPSRPAIPADGKPTVVPAEAQDFVKRAAAKIPAKPLPARKRSKEPKTLDQVTAAAAPVPPTGRGTAQPSRAKTPPPAPAAASTPASTAKAAQASPEHRRALFIEAYVANGRNATQAAISAGFSAKSAYSQGSRLLKNAEVSAAVEARSLALRQKFELTTDNVTRELSRLVFFDARKLVDANGAAKPMHEIDDDTAAAIAGLEVVEEFEGKGGDRVHIGYNKKFRISDKNTAITNAMKHLGMFEKDNAQQRDNLAIQVVMVAAPGVPR